MIVSGGKSHDIEMLAVDMAKRGQCVRLETPNGSLVLEPGTGNIMAVALWDFAAVKPATKMNYFDINEAPNTP